MRSKLISSLAGGAFCFAASGFAFAADMPANAPPLASAPIYGWTGWYAGLNLGYSWGNARTDTAGSATSISSPSFTNPPVAFANSQTEPLVGVIGGGQVGYNYQVGPEWVLGFEADIQGSAEQGSNNFVAQFSGTICSPGGVGVCAGTLFPLKGTAASTYQAKIEWLGTARGRVGVLINGGGLLLYGTGGLAYGQVSVSDSVNIIATAPAVPATFGPVTGTFSQSKTNIGFAAGAGMEGRIAPTNWTWKLEYLFVDLGSVNTSTSFAAASTGAFSALAGTATTHTNFIDNIFRAGVNYQFH
jgi:outer membrane immunogenic protein